MNNVRFIDIRDENSENVFTELFAKSIFDNRFCFIIDFAQINTV